MHHKLRDLVSGGSISYLSRVCSEDFVAYLRDNSMLQPLPTHANTYVKDGQFLSIISEEDRFYAAGMCDGVFVYDEISPQEAVGYKIDLKKFLSTILASDYFEASLKSLKPLRDGTHAYRVCEIRAYNVTIYFTLNNSDAEYAIIENESDNFNKGVVILSPDSQVPPSYKGVIGNCQHISIESLFDSGEDGKPAPLTAYLKSNSGSNVPPFQVCPNLRPGQVTWSDIQLTLHANHTIAIGIKGDIKPYPWENIWFLRSTTNTKSNELAQTQLLKTLAFLKKWKTFEDKRVQKNLNRLNAEMQIFFCQPKPFYEKGEDGFYHPRLKLVLDNDLRDQFKELGSKLADERSSSGLRKAQLASGLSDRNPGAGQL